MTYTGRRYFALTPPSSHEREHPLSITRQILEENRSVQHEVTPSSKCTQAHKESKNFPVRARACHYSKDGTDDERHVERNLSSNNVRAHAPEQCTHKHTHVCCDGETVGIAWVEFETCLPGDDGLDEQDEGVDRVAKTI